MTQPPQIQARAAQHRVQFDPSDTAQSPAQSPAWGGRVEHYPADPAQQPGPAKWETDVAYLTA